MKFAFTETAQDRPTYQQLHQGRVTYPSAICKALAGQDKGREFSFSHSQPSLSSESKNLVPFLAYNRPLAKQFYLREL